MRLPAWLLGAPLALACSSGSDAVDGAGADAGSDVSQDDGAAPDAEAAACSLSKPYSSKNATCDACAEQSCCEQVNACYADPDCDDGYVNCILACALLPGDAGDAGVELCTVDCQTQYPQGQQKYDAAIGCADAHCSAVCD